MPTSTPAPSLRKRKLACNHCGEPFACTLGGPCWCGEEAFRLPLSRVVPAADGGEGDCLCPTCLRAYAETLRGAA